MVRSSLLILTAAASVVGFAGEPTALADGPRTPQELDKASGDALAAAQAGKFEDAVGIWGDLLDEVPEAFRADIHANLAVAYKKMGRLPEAWHHFTAYVVATTGNDEKAAKNLKGIEEKLRKTHGKVRLECDPPTAVIHIGVDASGPGYACPLTWWFPAGEGKEAAATIFVELGGYKSLKEIVPVAAAGAATTHKVVLEAEVKYGMLSVEVPPGGTATERVPMPAVIGGNPPVGPTVEPGVGVAVERPAEAGGNAVWQWTLLGTGLGVAGVGAVLHYMGYRANEGLMGDYPPDVATKKEFDDNKKGYQDGFESDVQPLLTSSVALYCVGGALAAGGAVWMLIDAFSEPAAAEGRLQVLPLAMPGTFGLSVDGAF